MSKVSFYSNLHKVSNFEIEKEEFLKVCFMLRLDPEEVSNDVLKIGTIGLPNKRIYYNK